MAVAPNYDTMPESNAAEDSNTVGFLDLSLELRDQVYRELLYQPIGYGAARRCHKFETSILRVNKRINQEASRVLYEENAWVVFEIRLPGAVGLDVPSDHYLITTSRDIPRDGRLAFGGIPSLRVRVQVYNLRWFETIHYAIVPLEWVRDMTRSFVRGDIPYHDVYLEDEEFAVHFHENLKHESRRRMAMEFLELIRGVRKAKLYGLTPPSLRAPLAKQMRTPLKSIDELIDRISVYIRRAELMLAQGEVYLAEELYNHGYDSSTWAFRPGSITDVTPAKSKLFNSKLHESLEGSAVCSLRHGDSYHACRKLKDYILEDSEDYILDDSELSYSQKATGLYYYGLASVAAGFENEALYGFVLALLLIPGHEAADKEVDALDERVTKGMSPKTVMASILSNNDVEDMERYRLCLNLDLVKPCRHRNASDGELSLWQKHDLMTNFD